MPILRPPKKRWRWFLGYVAFWTILAVLASVETYLMQQKWDKPISWGLAFRRSFEEVYSYGTLAAGILWWCSRLPFEAGRLWRWIGAHLFACAIFTLSAAALVAWLWSGQRSVQTGKVLLFSEIFPKLAITCAVSSFYKYWIIVLGHLGWQYYLGYRERERQAAALATELVQARLQALRMQLNPHFLFNTLNAVLALIHENPKAADRMLVRLSQLLRRTLDQAQSHEIPLRDEVEFLKLYLEIEQMRFGDRLIIRLDIDPITLDLLVPQLILQPLVENALRHGILPREEPGHLEIIARIQDGVLQLKVRDDGNGLPPEAETPARQGVGLSNVRSRLSHLYGPAQAFSLRNLPQGGVEASIAFPCRAKGNTIQTTAIPSANKAGEEFTALKPAITGASNPF